MPLTWIPVVKDISQPKLYLDLVPESSWCSNLRNALPYEWDIVRKLAYQKYNYKCAICGGIGLKHPVEAHERWHYEDGVQTLLGIEAICPACHEVCHFGLTSKRGHEVRALNHLLKVNNWTKKQAQAHIELSFSQWEARSKLRWKLNVSWLKNSQIPLSDHAKQNIFHTGEFWTFRKEIGEAQRAKIEENNTVFSSMGGL